MHGRKGHAIVVRGRTQGGGQAPRSMDHAGRGTPPHAGALLARLVAVGAHPPARPPSFPPCFLLHAHLGITQTHSSKPGLGVRLCEEHAVRRGGDVRDLEALLQEWVLWWLRLGAGRRGSLRGIDW